MDRVKIAELIAEEWNREGIEYAVAHGVENYPNSLGRDLDVLMKKEDVERALKIVVEIGKNHDWICIRPPDLWGKRLVLFGKDLWRDALEIHTLTKLSWRGVTLAAEPQPTARFGPFKIDTWVFFVKDFLMILLAGQVERLNEAKIKKQLEAVMKHGLQYRLNELFGEDVSRSIIVNMHTHDSNSWRTLLPRMRRALVMGFVRKRPFEFAREFTLSLWRKFVQIFYPCGPIVAFIGERDTLKRAVLERIRQDTSIFTGVSIRKLPKGFVSVGRSLLQERIEASRQKIVIYDLGRREESSWFLRPDVTVFLGPEKKHHNLQVGSDNSVYIDASSPEEVIGRLQFLIMQAFIRKNGGSYVWARE